MSQWITQSTTTRIDCWITAENIIRSEHLPKPAKVEHFFEKAFKAINLAQQEIKYGKTISDLISQLDAIETNQLTTLATIRVWHYESGMELFNQALQNFINAGNLGLFDALQAEVDFHSKECKKQFIAAVRRRKLAEEFLRNCSTSELITVA